MEAGVASAGLGWLDRLGPRSAPASCVLWHATRTGFRQPACAHLCAVVCVRRHRDRPTRHAARYSRQRADRVESPGNAGRSAWLSRSVFWPARRFLAERTGRDLRRGTRCHLANPWCSFHPAWGGGRRHRHTGRPESSQGVRERGQRWPVDGAVGAPPTSCVRHATICEPATGKPSRSSEFLVSGCEDIPATPPKRSRPGPAASQRPQCTTGGYGLSSHHAADLRSAASATGQVRGHLLGVNAN
jgi:hypothetical protein